MSIRELKVLMWKHALVRSRRYIMTAVECFSPLLFFALIIFFARKATELKNKDTEARSEVMRLTDIRTPPYMIMYHPDSPLTNSLMDDVGAKLNLQRLVSNSELQMRNTLREKIPIPKKTVPPEKTVPPKKMVPPTKMVPPKKKVLSEKQVPSIPVLKQNTTISKTTMETRRDNAKLAKLTHGKERGNAKRLTEQQARQRWEAAEEAIRVEKQRQEEERMARIAAEFLADPLLELVEEEQFEWDHADEGLMVEKMQAAQGEKATAVTTEDIKQAPGEGIQLLDKIITPLHWIVYQPDSLLTSSFIDDIGAKLNLQSMAFTANHPGKGYFPLAKVSRLTDVATDMQMMEAVVIFNDMSRRSFPNRLNYTIRMKNAFHTETYEPSNDEPGPHKDYGIDYKTFMRIQWAIDSSYIKRLTGNDAPVILSLEEFSAENLKDVPIIAGIVQIAKMLCLNSLILTFVFHMVRLLQERTSGIQELMKSVGVSLNTLGISHFLNVLPCGLIFAIGGTILLKITKNPVLPKTNAVLICLMLFLYFNTLIALAFVCSYISRRTQYAATLSVLTFLVLFLPVQFVDSPKIPYILKLVCGLMPHVPMHWFWDELTRVELKGVGAHFGNMTKAHTKKRSFSVLLCIIFHLIQIIVYYLLAWYLSLVRPGYYGQARPWNFCFKREKKEKLLGEEEHEVITADPRYFEPAPANAEAGINIVNVTKAYPKHRALKNVSLEVYKGDITVLVGHNGAGKTTLMSIITGMTSATEGKVYVNGKDTVTEHKQVRKNIGLCPQHNLFFENLNVQEHIMFFTLLKHGTFAEARVSSRELAERLGLSDKLASMPNELSGGMKRRVQLACALAGGANVLVLDEPTSGLDVETRRELWDLLLSLRGDRTVLLSTHFMEEADALGDRVAALHAGVLRCNATTMHLKKAIGTGYRLSFTTFGVPKEKAISAVVKSHVPDATLKEKSRNTISFNLPASQSGKFPGLFAELEAKKAELGIDSIGVGASTLEEVFLKLCSDVDRSLYEDEVDTAGGGPTEPPPKKLTGFPLYIRQLFVLLKRQVKYAIHKIWVYLTLNFVGPILVALMMTSMSNAKPPEQDEKPRSLTMDLDMYGDRDYNRLLYHVEGPHVTQDDVDRMQARYPKVAFEKTDDVANTILRIGRRDRAQYNKYLAGLEVNETHAKVLYTTTVRHAAPVALNLLSNMLAAHYTRRSDGNTITTINDPIIRELSEQEQAPKNLIMLAFYGLVIIFTVMSVNINSTSLPCQERLTGSRHIHIMSGCPAELHWLATLCFHMTMCVLGNIIPIIIVAYFLDHDNTINQIDFLGVFAVVLMLGSLAFFPFCYLVSFHFGERATSIIMFAFCVLFGFITPPFMLGFEAKGSPMNPLYFILLVIYYIMPPQTMVMTGLKCLYVAQLNAWCKVLRTQCPRLFMNQPGFDSAKCCAGKKPLCYFCLNKYSPGKGMIVLFVQFLVMMTMVILTERKYFNGLINKMMNRQYKADQTEQDEIVREEKEYVSRTITKPVNEIPDAMLVDNLHKTYVPMCRKKVNAVKGVSFSVKKGECFGVLGVNGAGKSTCFKMITAEESATKGNIYSSGHHLHRGTFRYLQTLGYCPQFFGLDMFQTGEENLAMVLTLRGYDRQQVKNEVQHWIHIVGLEKYARNYVENYSGGCVRRLGAAAALCGDADVSLLDEPSAGVDVAARRRLWTALRKALKRQRSIVISSHSMDEMEALCSRIAILSAGRVRALGTAAGLRAAHAQGHAVVFKVKQMQEDGVKNAEIDRLKETMQKIFNCTLRDEHKTMLHYHINETMQYSVLFHNLDTLRKQFPIIEDYSVTETTLEEVFLSFAREQQEHQQHHGPHTV